MSNTGQGNRNNSLRTEKNIRRRTIDTAPYYDMKMKRDVLEGADCLTGVGFNVDDDEVNRRAGHVAIIHAGRVLVWGGYASEPQGSTWQDGRHRYWRTDWFMVLDPVTGIWNPKQTDPVNCPPLTSGATAAVIGNIVYIFCGHAIHFPEDYVLPTVDNNIREGLHPLLAVIDFTSGHNISEANSNEAYACDLSARPYPTWRKLNPSSQGLPPLPCDKLSSFVFQDKIYLFGGYGPQPSSDVHLKLPITTSWIMDPSETRFSAIARGWNNQLVIYEPSTNLYTWPKTLGKAPSPRAAHAMTLDTDNEIAYLFGGMFSSFLTTITLIDKLFFLETCLH